MEMNQNSASLSGTELALLTPRLSVRSQRFLPAPRAAEPPRSLVGLGRELKLQQRWENVAWALIGLSAVALLALSFL